MKQNLVAAGVRKQKLINTLKTIISEGTIGITSAIQRIC